MKGYNKKSIIHKPPVGNSKIAQKNVIFPNEGERRIFNWIFLYFSCDKNF